MKKIYLIRHGKAEEGYDKSDFERNLIEKGERKTKKTADFLFSQNVKIDLMLVSMAHRTQQTAQIIADKLDIPNSKIQIEKTLYLASTNGILNEIFALNDQIENIMIVGHNPGISSLAVYLSNSEDVDWMPTSGVAAIEIKTDQWTEIPNAKSKLIFYKTPAKL